MRCILHTITNTSLQSASAYSTNHKPVAGQLGHKSIVEIPQIFLSSFFMQLCQICCSKALDHFLVLKNRHRLFHPWHCPFFMSNYFFVLSGSPWHEQSPCSYCDQEKNVYQQQTFPLHKQRQYHAHCSINTRQLIYSQALPGVFLLLI